jgi:hypothetical protein
MPRPIELSRVKKRIARVTHREEAVGKGHGNKNRGVVLACLVVSGLPPRRREEEQARDEHGRKR